MPLSIKIFSWQGGAPRRGNFRLVRGQPLKAVRTLVEAGADPKIAAPDGTRIGHVTSGTMSPCMKVGFGLGYVTPEYAKAGTEIAVVVREKPLRAEVVKIPFV